MSQLVLSRGLGSRADVLKRYLLNLRIGPYFLVFSLVFFVVLITVVTLTFSTRQVTKGYVLSSLKAEQHDLLKDTEGKDMQISKVRSLSYIESLDKVKRMVKPGQVVFVAGGATLAQR